MIVESSHARSTYLGALGAAARGITRRQVGAALLFGAVVYAMHLLVQPNIWDAETWRLVAQGGHTPVRAFFSDEMGALALLLALALANRVTGGDPHRRIPYLFAVLGGAALWAITHIVVLRLLGISLGWKDFAATPEYDAIATLSAFFEWIMLNGAATYMYLDHIRARNAQASLRTAQSERREAAHRLLESQLQAMQARVEPKFLFNTLAHVRNLYANEFEVAQTVLDELIAYLRAAMPHMRSTTSTVAKEIDLARAYLHITRLSLRRLDVEIRMSDRAAAVRMPPMLLVPLIDRALARHPHIGAQDGSLRIACDCVGDAWLRIDVTDTGTEPVPMDDRAVAGIRDRLTALYGNRARLTLSATTGVTAYATVEIPLEAMVTARDEGATPPRAAVATVRATR
jgi:hypothetical protein